MTNAPLPSARRASLQAEGALVLVTLLWGMSFSWMKSWQDAAVLCPGGTLLSALTLIALRMAIACVLVLLFRRRLVTEATGREHAAGTAVGLAFGLGFALQVWGIAHTTPSLSAFFTSLCCAWAPLVGWLVLRLRIGWLPLVGLLIGLSGTIFFVEDDWRLRFGDTLTLIASLFFAAQMLLLDRLGRGVESARMTPAFFASAGAVAGWAALLLAAFDGGVEAWLQWLVGMLSNGWIALNVFLMALLPTFLAFHLMNKYQPRMPASRAALIYLLEPVFTAIISVSLGFEKLTLALLLGGGLILTGNLVVEIAGWLRPREVTQ